jgi:long-chain fatty acid transport protein
MKMNKVVVSLIAAGVMASPLAYATNGDLMMAVGSQNTALGGSGVANYVGAESTFPNPAMLGKSKGQEVTGGVALFMPTVSNNGLPYPFTGNPLTNGPQTTADSSADTNYIPDVSYSNRTSDNWTFGVAMAGIAGMGVDYTGATPGLVKAKTEMMLLKVVPTVAYNKEKFGVGFSPIIQYGSLSLAYNATPYGSLNYNPNHDASTDTNVGYSLGGYFDITPGLTVAAAFNSQISMKYGKQLSGAGVGFGQVFQDELAQPAEIKAGVAYSFASRFTVTADYKLIKWADAPGYKAFGWEDQTVIALGGKYAGERFWLGAGYNDAKNPIKPYNNGAPLTPAGNNGGVVNMFNNLLFPAIAESSYTFGGGYAINKAFDIEGSLVVTPEVKATVDISDVFGAASGTYSNTTTHSQQSYSVSLRYKF